MNVVLHSRNEMLQKEELILVLLSFYQVSSQPSHLHFTFLCAT